MGSESGLENRDHRWFKTKVKGGEDTLRYLTRAASEESAFIVSAAATTLRLIQIGQVGFFFFSCARNDPSYLFFRISMEESRAAFVSSAKTLPILPV